MDFYRSPYYTPYLLWKSNFQPQSLKQLTFHPPSPKTVQQYPLPLSTLVFCHAGLSAQQDGVHGSAPLDLKGAALGPFLPLFSLSLLPPLAATAASKEHQAGLSPLDLCSLASEMR